MKSIMILSALSLFFILGLFQSCELAETDPCADVLCPDNSVCLDGSCNCINGFFGPDCESHCGEEIIGKWIISNGTTACDLTFYEFTIGAVANELNLMIENLSGHDITGTATLSDDCSTASYQVRNNVNNFLFSSYVTFTGNTLVDSLAGCNFLATKQ